MANATSRPEAPVFRSTESCILYGLEATHGVPVTPSIYSDRVTKGRIYAHPNVQTRRHVGGRVDRRGGIIRAGMDGLDLEVQTPAFIRHAIRSVDGSVGGTWSASGRVPSLSILAGNAGADALLLWGAVIDSLDLSQEYSEDGEVLKASVTLLALGGDISGTTGFVGGALPDPVLFGWQSAVALTGPVTPPGGLRVREWKLGIKNNHKYMSYGDLQPASRGLGASGLVSLREAYELKAGEEEIELELSVEVPVIWNAALQDDFLAACYTPGTLAFAATYEQCGAAVDVLYVEAANLVAAPDQGFEYEYDAEGANGDPVHVYSFRAVKADPTLPSVRILAAAPV
jgi:hypothetical protein